jgi:hypothetical protein
MEIHNRLATLDKRWNTGQSDIYDNLKYKPQEKIKRAYYMLNFTHLNGERDENSKLKPYMDMFQRVMDTAEAGEDIDTKDFDFEAIDPDYYIQSFLIEKEHQDWMREVNWGQTIDLFGAIRRIFGYAWLKALRHNGKLDFDVVNWATLTPDPDDFEGDKFETHQMNKSELIEMKNSGWDEDQVDRLLEKENDSFEVKEWHGVASKAEYLEFNGEEYSKEDKNIYDRYTFIYAVCDPEEDTKELKDKDVVRLYSGKETKPIYYGLKYGKNPRGELGIGIAEKTFQPQQWFNHYSKLEKDAIELGSKILIQSPKGNKSKGKNVFSNVKTGTFLEHTDGKPYAKLDLTPQSITRFDSMWNKLKQISDEGNSVYSANTGSELPSNQTLRGLVLQAQQANNPFAQRVEELDLFFRELYDEEIIPHLIKRIRNKKQVTGEYSFDQLIKLDEEVSEHIASKEIVGKLLSGKYDSLPVQERMAVLGEDKMRTKEAVRSKLHKGKNLRWFGHADFDEMFKDMHKKVRLIITDEQKNKRAYLSNLSELLNIAGNPAVQQNPKAKAIIDQMMESVGMSPITVPDAQPDMVQAPAQLKQAPDLQTDQQGGEPIQV